MILDYPATAPFWRDLGLYVTLLMAAFSILFGTRHIDATEHHQGMVAAIALESVVKLLAFVTIGAFVTYGMFDGFGDIFARQRCRFRPSPDLRGRRVDLRRLVGAHLRVRARDPVPAAPVPGGGDRMSTRIT